MKTQNLLIILLILLFVETSYSQDIIYLRKDTIQAEITEIGIKSIKFKEEAIPVREIGWNNILKIEYANGKVEDFGSNNPRKQRPLNLGICISNFMFEELYMAEFEMNYFIKPYLAFNPSVGIDTDWDIYLNVGPRLYFNRINSTHKLVPFIGCQVGITYIGFYDDAAFTFKTLLGIDYITKKGYNFGLEYCPISIPKYDYARALIGIKIGKNF